MDAPKVLCTVDEARCNRCGLCVEACPCHSVSLGEHGPVFNCPEVCTAQQQEICYGCGYMCEEVCPTDAIACRFDIVLGQ